MFWTTKERYKEAKESFTKTIHTNKHMSRILFRKNCARSAQMKWQTISWRLVVIFNKELCIYSVSDSVVHHSHSFSFILTKQFVRPTWPSACTISQAVHRSVKRKRSGAKQSQTMSALKNLFSANFDALLQLHLSGLPLRVVEAARAKSADLGH